MDMPIDVCMDRPIDVCMDMPIDVCMDMPIDVCMDMPIDAGVDMFAQGFHVQVLCTYLHTCQRICLQMSPYTCRCTCLYRYPHKTFGEMSVRMSFHVACCNTSVKKKIPG